MQPSYNSKSMGLEIDIDYRFGSEHTKPDNSNVMAPGNYEEFALLAQPCFEGFINSIRRFRRRFQRSAASARISRASAEPAAGSSFSEATAVLAVIRRDVGDGLDEVQQRVVARLKRGRGYAQPRCARTGSTRRKSDWTAGERCVDSGPLDRLAEQTLSTGATTGGLETSW